MSTAQPSSGPRLSTAHTEVRCSLCVFSDDMHPDRITEVVGIPPTLRRQKGEPVTRRRSTGPVVRRHQWIWEVSADVEAALAPQLATLRASLGLLAERFSELSATETVVFNIVISHYGSYLSLGWTLGPDDIELVAGFGAALSVDEYDYTEP